MFRLELLIFIFSFGAVMLVLLLIPAARRVCSVDDSAPTSDVVSEQIGPRIEFAGYAGFWRRFGACLIDGVVTGLIAVLVGVMSGFALGVYCGFLVVFLRWPRLSSEELAGYVAVAGAAIGITASIVYCAVMESSASQATLGKMALGVRVTDLDGGRISFARALGRLFSKIASLLIFCIGFVMAALTEKHQGLHDIIAGTLVMKVRSSRPTSDPSHPSVRGCVK